mmetsp:Transcript_46198/g.121106  ORF Transcript_46198/g.121106 Transcript_46198/m.121106 type:complete len:482 (+) Transcript_46198:107-1552(+)
MLSRLIATLHPHGPPSNNKEMVFNLTRHGSIQSPEVIFAFSNVDRGHFIDQAEDSTGEDTRFRNHPYRNGVQHLSAPGIYGTALEALELREGMSFLNVCSGTGYFSAVASQILGKKAVQRAVELRVELVHHARVKLREIDCEHIEVVAGSCLALCPRTSMRFERIYLGAGADETMAGILLQMLEPGGVLVGPFSSADGSQRLLRICRMNEGSFDVQELMHVQFTPLLPTMSALPHLVAPPGVGTSEWAAQAAQAALPPSPLLPPVGAHPPAGTPSPVRAGGTQAAGEVSPANSGLLTLLPPVWSEEMHGRFPKSHQTAVRTILMAHARAESPLARVPKEVLLGVLLPQLPYAAFRSQGAAAVTAGGDGVSAGGTEAACSSQSTPHGSSPRPSGESEDTATRSRSDDDEEEDDGEEETSVGKQRRHLSSHGRVVYKAPPSSSVVAAGSLGDALKAAITTPENEPSRKAFSLGDALRRTLANP